jgi:hypothetical protein
MTESKVGIPVKNPVLPHGASSKEKAILAIHPLPSEASWLFHAKPVTGVQVAGHSPEALDS